MREKTIRYTLSSNSHSAYTTAIRSHITHATNSNIGCMTNLFAQFSYLLIPLLWSSTPT